MVLALATKKILPCGPTDERAYSAIQELLVPGKLPTLLSATVTHRPPTANPWSTKVSKETGRHHPCSEAFGNMRVTNNCSVMLSSAAWVRKVPDLLAVPAEIVITRTGLSLASRRWRQLIFGDARCRRASNSLTVAAIATLMESA